MTGKGDEHRCWNPNVIQPLLGGVVDGIDIIPGLPSPEDPGNRECTPGWIEQLVN